jgi:type IV pilus assembly protein PilN
MQINLLSWRDNVRKQQKQQVIIMAAVAVSLAVLYVGISYWLNSSALSSQQYRNSYLQTQLATIEAEHGNLKDIPDKGLILQQELQRLVNNNNLRFSLIKLLNELGQQMPDDVFLTQLSLDNTMITLQGEAPNNTQISTFINNLAKLDWISSPVLNLITNPDDKETNKKHFQLSFSFKSVNTAPPISTKKT